MAAAEKSVKIEVVDPSEEQIEAIEGDVNVKIAEPQDPDATDYSSSFDGTVSGTENFSGLSDNEVESHLYGEDNFSFDGFSSMFPMRKKKMTTHWRNFIRPLMWRCKWAELKIMELQSQASKYDREIAGHDKRNKLKLDHYTLETFGSKSLPLISQSHREKPMKRRKRKRVEDDTTDIASYLSQHNLFSYLENRKSEQDGSSVIEEFGNPVISEQNLAGHEDFGIHDDCSFHEMNNSVDFMGEILRNVEEAHSRVQKLKSRLVMVFAENCMNFSSSEDLSLVAPCDGQTSSARSPTFSACIGDTSSLGALLNEIGDFVVPESMVANYGEPFCVPDIIESTVSLLSSVDVTMHQPQIGDSCEAIMDNVQIQKEAAEEERDGSENLKKQIIVKHQGSEGGGEEGNEPPQIAASETDVISKPPTPNEQSRLSSCLASDINFPKSKRKRGERKAGSGGWSR